MSESLIIRIPNVRVPEHTWIVKTMLTTYLGLDISIEQHGLSTIRITDVSDNSVLELPSILLMENAFEWDVALAVPETVPHWIHPSSIPWPMPEPDVMIPVLFASDMPDRIRSNENKTHLEWDLFGSAFFMLTRLEEVLSNDVDEHGRFPAASSLAVKCGFERTPVVNAWGDILWGALHSLMPNLARKQHVYKVKVSHDVDWPLISNRLPLQQILKSSAGDILVRKSPITAARRILGTIAPEPMRPRINPGNTFDFIMRTSEQFGLSSAFYFIPENTAGAIDGTYSLDMPFVGQLLKNIHARGHEIGIHPGYDTFRAPGRVTTAFQKLLAAIDDLGIQQDTWGGRQHYLRWSAAETWRHWESAGLTYDSTVGYAETVGFRAGACFEYPVFDIVEGRELSLIERPLVVMEGALFRTTSPLNLGLTDNEGSMVMSKVIDTVRAYRGCFTLLWHNSSLITVHQKALYSRTLEQVIPTI